MHRAWLQFPLYIRCLLGEALIESSKVIEGARRLSAKSSKINCGYHMCCSTSSQASCIESLKFAVQIIISYHCKTQTITALAIRKFQKVHCLHMARTGDYCSAMLCAEWQQQFGGLIRKYILTAKQHHIYCYSYLTCCWQPLIGRQVIEPVSPGCPPPSGYIIVF